MNQDDFDNDRAERIRKLAEQHGGATATVKPREPKERVAEKRVTKKHVAVERGDTPADQLAEIIAGDSDISHVAGNKLAIELGMRMQQLEDGTFRGHFRNQNMLMLEKSGLSQDTMADISKVLGAFKQTVEARERESRTWNGR